MPGQFEVMKFWALTRFIGSKLQVLIVREKRSSYTGAGRPRAGRIRYTVFISPGVPKPVLSDTLW